MANEVYANGMELACKAGAGKTICSFPDVCFTPPENPATPPGVPVPYPNTGFASDTTEGSKTVKITNKEVMLKNKSYFKKSTGDEAGCAAKKGVLSSTHRGKVYFIKWSMDVKFEGENVDRHLDMTTDNHNSPNANEAVPWPFTDQMAIPLDHPCVEDMKREQKACDGVADPCVGVKKENKPSMNLSRDEAKPLADKLSETVRSNPCLEARRCMLSPYKGKGVTCCPGQTPHHIVEASSFGQGRGEALLSTFPNAPQEYDGNDAPCVCAEGTSSAKGGTHELMHSFQKAAASKCPDGTLPLASGGQSKEMKVTKYGDAKKSGLDAFEKVFGYHCNRACLEAQLDEYHSKSGINNDTECQAVTAGPSDENAAQIQRDHFERLREEWMHDMPFGD